MHVANLHAVSPSSWRAHGKTVNNGMRIQLLVRDLCRRVRTYAYALPASWHLIYFSCHAARLQPKDMTFTYVRVAMRPVMRNSCSLPSLHV